MKEMKKETKKVRKEERQKERKNVVWPENRTRPIKKLANKKKDDGKMKIDQWKKKEKIQKYEI